MVKYYFVQIYRISTSELGEIMKKLFFVIICLFLGIKLCFAETQDIVLINNSQSGNPIRFDNGGTYTPPTGKEIESAVIEIHWEISGFNPDYREYVDVYAGDSGYYGDTDYSATETSKTVSFDVTSDVKDGSLNYLVSLQFTEFHGHTLNANVTAVLHLTLKDKTSPSSESSGTATKTPIPLPAIIIALITIPLIALRIRK
jgi:hypothetical protein